MLFSSSIMCQTALPYNKLVSITALIDERNVWITFYIKKFIIVRHILIKCSYNIVRTLRGHWLCVFIQLKIEICLYCIRFVPFSKWKYFVKKLQLDIIARHMDIKSTFRSMDVSLLGDKRHLTRLNTTIKISLHSLRCVNVVF